MRATCPPVRANSVSKNYIDYVIDYTRLLGPDVHLMAVCQPSVPTMVGDRRDERTQG